MNPALALLPEVTAALSLAYEPSAGRPPDGVLLGAFPLLMEESLRQQVAFALNPDLIHIVPPLIPDPLGYVLAAAPVCNRKELAENLRQAADGMEKYAILQKARWSHYHLHLAPTHLTILGGTCIANGITGVIRNSNEIRELARDTALVYRIKEQTYYLLLPPNDLIVIPEFASEDEKVAWLQEYAAKELAGISSFTLYRNWSESHIRRRGHVHDEHDLVVRLKLRTPSTERRGILTSVRNIEMDEDAERRGVQEQAEAQAHRQGARRKWPPLILSGMPPHDGLTEPLQAFMMRAALMEWTCNPGALLFLLQSTSFLSLHDIHSSRVVTRGEVNYLATPTPSLARGEVNGDQHLHVENAFSRRIANELAGPLRHMLETIPHEQLPLELSKWLSKFKCRPGQLTYALRWNAPVWNNCSWLLPELGLCPVEIVDGKPKAAGFRSYLVWHPAMQEGRHLDLLHKHGLSAEPDVEVSAVACCGSRHCVKPEIAGRLFATLDELVASANAHFPEDYLEMASLLNAIAAATRLLEVLLTFRRNYPEPAPAVIYNRGRLELLLPQDLIHEKIRARPVVVPPFLQDRLLNVARIFERAESQLEKQGYEVVRPGVCDNHVRAYGFLPLGANIGKTLPIDDPRKRLVIEGLLNNPATEPFASIHPNAMRNLSYLILTSDGEFEREAMQLHDHYPGGGDGAMDKHSMLSVTAQKLRIAAANKITNFLGLI